MSQRITIATPCYNEAESLPSYFERITVVLEELSAKNWEADLLLIDDGSRDSTYAILTDFAAREPRAKAVCHPRNLGYGGAIKTALALAEGDWVAFVDADSNYDQRLILQLVRHIGADTDLINVSILAPGGLAGYPWHRKLLSSSASLVYRILFPRLTRNVYTMTCGFRVYRRSIVPEIFPRADDFFATAEIMLRTLQAGARVLEFPATNARREHGSSKLRFVRVMLGHMSLALRTRLAILPPPGSVHDHLARIGH